MSSKKRTYDFNNIAVSDFNDEIYSNLKPGAMNGWKAFIWINIVFWGSIFSGGPIWMFFIAYLILKRKSNKRATDNAYRYYKLLKSRDSFTIDEVAYFMNLPVSKVQADLQYLFDNNVIIPDLRTIVYSESKPVTRKYNDKTMYRSDKYAANKIDNSNKSDYKYEDDLKSYVPPSKATLNVKEEYIPASDTADNIYAETMAYIRRIRKANDDVPGESMSAKIDELEKITLNIYNATVENKEYLKKTKKFMSYYLPTTEKLIAKYAELDRIGIETENTLAIKNKIEESLGTITKAFYELYDDLYDYDAIDITSEIEAFKNTLVNDGLLESGLEIEKEIEK